MALHDSINVYKLERKSNKMIVEKIALNLVKRHFGSKLVLELHDYD